MSALDKHVHVSRPVHRARFNENVLGFAAIGPAIHPQRAADGARDTSQKG